MEAIAFVEEKGLKEDLLARIEGFPLLRHLQDVMESVPPVAIQKLKRCLCYEDFLRAEYVFSKTMQEKEVVLTELVRTRAEMEDLMREWGGRFPGLRQELERVFS